jgi:hypothetical protein
MFPATLLVDYKKVGSTAWEVSYRSVDAGTVPAGANNFDAQAVSNIKNPYSTMHADNMNALYLIHQTVIDKGVILSFEYQKMRIKNQGLTNLTSKDLGSTYMMKLEYFY